MHRYCVPFFVGLLLFAAVPSHADVFVLRNGGTIEGELLNPDEKPRQTYVVATLTGGRLTLPKEQVVDVRRKSEQELLYERYLPRMPENADGNWIMAEWCREKGLTERRQHHLEQVLAHDADHEKARYALGYTRLGDDWVQTNEWMTRQGFIKHKGTWRLPQEIELETQSRKRELAVKGWTTNLKRWREALIGRSADRAQDARRSVMEIRDLHAAPGLAKLLENETFLAAKLIFIEKLSELNCRTSTDALLKCAMEDKSTQVQENCWDALADDASPTVVASLIKELESKDNLRVNRAAVGLERMNDPAAILPLINALVTKHKFKIVTGRGNMSASFGRPGTGTGGTPGMGFGAGGGGPKIVETDLKNRDVLNALSVLTGGAQFQFEEDRWKDWYARLNTPPNVDLRRIE
jgi:hypothetical protein